MTYRDIDPDLPASLGGLVVRELVEDRAEDLAKLIHYSDIVSANEQWTLRFELDCGFRCSIQIRVDASGSCERRAGTGRQNGTH